MSYSFYGGQQGKNFEIAKIFHNRYELSEDLKQRYHSNIAIGDLVFISYGMPSNNPQSSYIKNRDIDNLHYHKSYNGTLWQKIYLDETQPVEDGVEITLVPVEEEVEGYNLPTISNEQFGLAYKSIAMLTGSTPNLQIELGESVNAKDDPTIDLIVVPDETHPTASTDTPILVLHLPTNQIIGKGKFEKLNAGSDPTFNIDSSNINNPKIDLGIPQAQVLEVNPIKPENILPPKGDPTLSYDKTNINNPKITFNLPRAVKFAYGDLLGQKTGGTLVFTPETTTELSGLKPGDYYINKTTGFIYEVTEEGENSRTFEYQACLAAPVPGVAPDSDVSPYYVTGQDESGKDIYASAEPSIALEYDNPAEEIGPKFKFGLPRLPIFAVRTSSDPKGPDEAVEVVGEVTGTDTYTFTFSIPSGTRFYCGDKVDDDKIALPDFVNPITEALPGDFYINTNPNSNSNGRFYKLNTDYKWIVQDGSVKGSQGDALNIVLDCTINASDSITNDKNAIGAQILTKLGRYPKSDEIVAVTYHNTDGSNIAYWQYYVNGEWGRVQLTGATTNFIQTMHENANDYKAYSVTYVNGLINNLPFSGDKTLKTYSAEAIDQLLEQQAISWGKFTDL